MSEELQEGFVSEAVVDPVTGAFNRRHMAASLDLAIEQGRRRPPCNALLLIDIDHFDSVNDRFGRAGGDRLLRAVVELVNGRKRRIDSLFRIGGEEFLLLLLDADLANARMVAEALRQRVAEAPILEGHPVSVSVGVAAQRAGETADEWVRRAARALYRARECGHNRVEVDGAAT